MEEDCMEQELQAKCYTENSFVQIDWTHLLPYAIEYYTDLLQIQHIYYQKIFKLVYQLDVLCFHHLLSYYSATSYVLQSQMTYTTFVILAWLKNILAPCVGYFFLQLFQHSPSI